MKEATRRFQKHGANVAFEEKKISFLSILLKQFNNVLCVVLLIASLASFALNEYVDALIILVVIIVNAFLGAYQEYKAKTSLESIKKFSEDKTLTLRDNKLLNIKNSLLTIGDIIYLIQGDNVPVDARIIEGTSFLVDESLITGESKYLEKTFRPLDSSNSTVPIFDQKNMIFAGTKIVKGNCWAVTTGIGKNSYIGKIAERLQKISQPKTTLEKQINKLSSILALVGVISLVLVVASGSILNKDINTYLLLGVSIGVSVVPEGLPILLTLTQAFGMKRLLLKKVLVKHLSAVETLSSVNAICVDKTGTLTYGKMQVKNLTDENLNTVEAGSDCYNKIKSISVLCSTSFLESSDETEVSLLKFFRLVNSSIRKIRGKYANTDVIPFASTYKYMAALYMINGEAAAFIKGAPEALIEKSDLSEENKQHIHKRLQDLGRKGYRILAFGEKRFTSALKKLDHSMLDKMTFIGCAVFVDPVREDVKLSMERIRKAGVLTYILTGDGEEVTQVVARKVGVNGEKTISGKEFEALAKRKQVSTLKTARIFYRMTPEQKYLVLTRLQEQGYKVAMTGDGSNDALSLKQADLGIAMANATDITKESADIILLDSSFTKIVEAIYEGRKIFTNIKKFIILTLSSNFDELLLIIISSLVGLPLLLLPVHILFLNLVTDTLPSLALASDRVDKRVLYQKPKLFLNLLSHTLKLAVIVGVVDLIIDFAVFGLAYFHLEYPLQTARSFVLFTTASFELIIAYTVRIKGFKNFFDNRNLNTASFFTLLLILSAIYVPFLQPVFKTSSLPLNLIVVATVLNLMGGVVIGILFRRYKKSQM